MISLEELIGKMWCPNCQGYVRNKPGIHSEQVYVKLSYHEVSEKGMMTYKYRCPSCKCEFVVTEEGEQGQRLTLMGRQEESEAEDSSTHSFSEKEGMIWNEASLKFLVPSYALKGERQQSIFLEAIERINGGKD
ncbi:MAG: hypothetical protein GF308_21870 [Candidatus Heimdallarchaeota archaeon]|nr:hypothetical protein [Candidatus Heimdallarchaeota archaeon]